MFPTHSLAAGAPVELSATPVTQAIVIAELNRIPCGKYTLAAAPAGSGIVRNGAVAPTVTLAVPALKNLKNLVDDALLKMCQPYNVAGVVLIPTSASSMSMFL